MCWRCRRTYANTKIEDERLRSSPVGDHRKGAGNALIVTINSNTGGSLAENNGEVKRFWKGSEEVQALHSKTGVQLRTKDGKAKPNKLYTVLCLDCDAPGKNANCLSDIVHGVWCDLPVNAGANASEHCLVSWAPPGPPFGVHRYCFFVLEQPRGEKLRGQMEEDRALVAMQGEGAGALWARMGFKGEKFKVRYGLELRASAFFEASKRKVKEESSRRPNR